MSTINTRPIPQFWEDINWLNLHLSSKLKALFSSANESANTLKLKESVTTSYKCLSQETRVAISSARLVGYHNAGGLSAEMNRINIILSSGETVSLVYKRNSEVNKKRSAALGLPRESLFYEKFADFLSSHGVSLPKVVYAYGSMELGEKDILMEDLSDCIQSGLFFGNHSPLNWGKDVETLTAPATITCNKTSLEWMEFITTKAFLEAAKMHRTFWKSPTLLLDKDWLRGSNWYLGKDKLSWLASHDTTKQMWEECKLKIFSAASYTVKWKASVIDCINTSISKISWEDYQLQLKAGSGDSLSYWTLVHGDFHPANMMWRHTLGNEKLYLLDWEVVGVGNGAQDLGQFMISHVKPETRRCFEDRVLRLYYSELTSGVQGIEIGKEYSWEQCHVDYTIGGIGRWMWMLPFLTSMCPDNVVQYFHDQVAAFIEDHSISSENVSMPRV